MGGKSKDRFDPPAAGVVHQERFHHRARAALPQSIAEGTSLRHEDVDLFHQSRRQSPEPKSTGRIGKGEDFVVEISHFQTSVNAPRPINFKTKASPIERPETTWLEPQMARRHGIVNHNNLRPEEPQDGRLIFVAAYSSG